MQQLQQVRRTPRLPPAALARPIRTPTVRTLSVWNACGRAEPRVGRCWQLCPKYALPPRVHVCACWEAGGWGSPRAAMPRHCVSAVVRGVCSTCCNAAHLHKHKHEHARARARTHGHLFVSLRVCMSSIHPYSAVRGGHAHVSVQGACAPSTCIRISARTFCST